MMLNSAHSSTKLAPQCHTKTAQFLDSSTKLAPQCHTKTAQFLDSSTKLAPQCHTKTAQFLDITVYSRLAFKVNINSRLKCILSQRCIHLSYSRTNYQLLKEGKMKNLCVSSISVVEALIWVPY